MSFKEKFPRVAAFFSTLTAGANEITAEEGFAKVELTAKQFDALEVEMNALASAKETAEAAAQTAADELVKVKAENDTLSGGITALTDKVTALEADVVAKDLKLAEFSAIAAGESTVAKTKGDKHEDANSEDGVKFTADYAAKNLGLI
jgi:predicted  nucleic acid-binding Zn-ribbon protein